MNVRITPQKLARAGVDALYYIDDDQPEPEEEAILNVTDTFLVRNNGRVFLHVKKAEAANCVVTVDTPGTVDGLAIADREITVEASVGDKFIGPFPPSIYNDGNGDLKFSLSNVAGLEVAVLSL